MPDKERQEISSADVGDFKGIINPKDVAEAVDKEINKEIDVKTPNDMSAAEMVEAMERFEKQPFIERPVTLKQPKTMADAVNEEIDKEVLAGLKKELDSPLDDSEDEEDEDDELCPSFDPVRKATDNYVRPEKVPHDALPEFVETTPAVIGVDVGAGDDVTSVEIVELSPPDESTPANRPLKRTPRGTPYIPRESIQKWINPR